MTHTALNEILVAEIGSPMSHPSDNVFAMFQHLAERTKNWLHSNQLDRAEKCFNAVNAMYDKCSSQAQLAIENVFMFSIACCIDGLSNAQEVFALLPHDLKMMAAKYRHAQDI